MSARVYFMKTKFPCLLGHPIIHNLAKIMDDF